MSKYYVVSETGVETYRSLTNIKKDTNLTKDDFTQVGTDYILYITDQSLEISRDIKMLERVASQKVFSKDKMDLTNWLQIFTIIVVYFATK